MSFSYYAGIFLLSYMFYFLFATAILTHLASGRRAGGGNSNFNGAEKPLVAYFFDRVVFSSMITLGFYLLNN